MRCSWQLATMGAAISLAHAPLPSAVTTQTEGPTTAGCILHEITQEILRLLRSRRWTHMQPLGFHRITCILHPCGRTRPCGLQNKCRPTLEPCLLHLRPLRQLPKHFSISLEAPTHLLSTARAGAHSMHPSTKGPSRAHSSQVVVGTGLEVSLSWHSHDTGSTDGGETQSAPRTNAPLSLHALSQTQLLARTSQFFRPCGNRHHKLLQFQAPVFVGSELVTKTRCGRRNFSQCRKCWHVQVGCVTP